MVDVPPWVQRSAAMLAVVYDHATCDGDVVYDGGRLVDEGRDLESALVLSLLLNAAAQPGDDVLPDGPRNGFWADAFEPVGEAWGSRLWMLADAVCNEETATRARTYAAEATAWAVTGSFVRSIEWSTELGDENILLSGLVTQRDGSVVVLGPFDVTRS